MGLETNDTNGKMVRRPPQATARLAVQTYADNCRCSGCHQSPPSLLKRVVCREEVDRWKLVRKRANNFSHILTK